SSSSREDSSARPTIWVRRAPTALPAAPRTASRGDAGTGRLFPLTVRGGGGPPPTPCPTPPRAQPPPRTPHTPRPPPAPAAARAGGVDGTAGGQPRAGAGVAGDPLAGVPPDPVRELPLPARGELLVQLQQRALHVGRGPHRPEGVVLVHPGQAEHRHDRVAD